MFIKEIQSKSESLLAHGGVLLALSQDVHVLLAGSDIVLVGLEAVHELVTLEGARVLLVLLLGSSVVLGILLLSGGLRVSRTTSHHRSDGLVSNLGTSSESSTLNHGLTEAREHSRL